MHLSNGQREPDGRCAARTAYDAAFAATHGELTLDSGYSCSGTRRVFEVRLATPVTSPHPHQCRQGRRRCARGATETAST